jgi:zinc transport system permease protein
MTSVWKRAQAVTEFVEALWQHSFLQYALLTGVLASIACGIIGTYVVTRRITYIGGGIAHSVLGGMGVAYYLSVVYKWNSLQPIYGAIIAALASAIIIGLVSLKAKQREDTVIGALWAIGMAVGIIFIAKTPGYNQDLMSYLFGNILMVTTSDLWLIAGLDALVFVVSLMFYYQFQAVCFDEEFARVRGINVEFYYLMLLCITALTVVILVTVVGIVMVIALLTLPAAIAGRFSKTLWQTMFLAAIFSIIFVTLGLAISYSPDLPAGATIILLAGGAYLLVSISGSLLKPGRS